MKEELDMDRFSERTLSYLIVGVLLSGMITIGLMIC